MINHRGNERQRSFGFLKETTFGYRTDYKTEKQEREVFSALSCSARRGAQERDDSVFILAQRERVVFFDKTLKKLVVSMMYRFSTRLSDRFQNRFGYQTDSAKKQEKKFSALSCSARREQKEIVLFDKKRQRKWYDTNIGEACRIWKCP